MSPMVFSQSCRFVAFTQSIDLSLPLILWKKGTILYFFCEAWCFQKCIHTKLGHLETLCKVKFVFFFFFYIKKKNKRLVIHSPTWTTFYTFYMYWETRIFFKKKQANTLPAAYVKIDFFLRRDFALRKKNPSKKFTKICICADNAVK